MDCGILYGFNTLNSAVYQCMVHMTLYEFFEEFLTILCSIIAGGVRDLWFHHVSDILDVVFAGLHPKTPVDTFINKNMLDSYNKTFGWHVQPTLITRDDSATPYYDFILKIRILFRVLLNHMCLHKVLRDFLRDFPVMDHVTQLVSCLNNV